MRSRANVRLVISERKLARCVSKSSCSWELDECMKVMFSILVFFTTDGDVVRVGKSFLDVCKEFMMLTFVLCVG